MSNRKTMIFSDTTSDLSPDIIATRDIRINPLTVVFGSVNHADGIDVKPDDVYKFYKDSGTLPKTTASNIAEHEKFISDNLAEGCGAVYFTISSEMSANYNNARLAAENFDDVYVIDSRSLSTGIGLLVLHAADLADKGMDAKEIRDEILTLVDKVDASFVVDTLEYLHKGGRCSSVAALGANLLKLKPCIQVNDGKMSVLKKYRGRLNDVIKQYVEERLSDDNKPISSRIFLTHSGGCEEIAEQLKKEVLEKYPDKEVIITHAGCTVCVHCGPGTLGILMIREHAI